MIPQGFKFRLEELVDKKSFLDWGEGCWNFFPQDSLYMLHGIRTFLDRPITVNNWLWGGDYQYRGYRGPACQIGAKMSYHKRGMAFDFGAKGLTAEDVRKILIENQDHELLLLIKRLENKVTWVHADTGVIPEGRKRIYLFNP